MKTFEIIIEFINLHFQQSKFFRISSFSSNFKTKIQKNVKILFFS